MNLVALSLRRTLPELINNGALTSNHLPRFLTYKSSISLQNLYPNSSLTLTTPSPPEKCDYVIPIDQLDITYSRSSAPGGQNVNKVSTKVDVRFHLATAKWLTEDVRQKLTEQFRNKLTKDGYLIFRSELTRSQQLNLADCLEKIRRSIRETKVERREPSQESQERIRKRLEASSRERLIVKRDRSQIKEARRNNISVEL